MSISSSTEQPANSASLGFANLITPSCSIPTPSLARSTTIPYRLAYVRCDVSSSAIIVHRSSSICTSVSCEQAWASFNLLSNSFLSVISRNTPSLPFTSPFTSRRRRTSSSTATSLPSFLRIEASCLSTFPSFINFFRKLSLRLELAQNGAILFPRSSCGDS